jgi:hypothetical protein
LIELVIKALLLFQDTLPSSSYGSALASVLSKSELASEVDEGSAQQQSDGYW